MPKRPGIAITAACACAVGLTVTAGSSARADVAKPRAVLELFTSQGCGRCPPADALLTTLSADPTLVTLSYAVDYWDYLGWKDTAAKPEFTQRQRAYSETRGDRAVYTPQIVVNGRTHVVGSDREAIDRAVAEHVASARAPRVDLDVEASGDALVVRIAEAPAGIAATRATVWLARYDRSRTVPIRKGENSGRTVTYTHLVKSLQPIGMWKGKAVRIELPRQETVHDDAEGCVVLLQADGEAGPGPILGAHLIERAGS